MAYAYRAVDELLEPQKQNIFASEQGGGPVPGQTQSQGDGVKTSTSSEVGSGGGSSEAGPSASQPLDTGAASRAAVKANAGKTAQPSALGQVQSQLSRNQAALQSEADAYVTKGKAAQAYALGSNDFEGAIGGDQAKANSVKGLLGRQDINAVDDFKFSNPEVRDADLLRNDAGLKQLASRGQGPGYTSGMGAFDVQALRKTPGFENIVSMIQGQQQALNDKTAELEKNKRGEVEAYGKEALTKAQKDATGYLTGAAGRIDAANEKEAAAYNALLDSYRRNGVPDAERKALEGAKEAVRGKIEARAEGFVDKAKVDPRQYLKVSANAGRDDFVDDKEAATFNSIMGLLGSGDTRNASAALTDPYSFDNSSLEAKIASGAAGLRKEADTQQRAALSKITKSATTRANEANAKNAKIDLKKVASDEAGKIVKTLPKDMQSYYKKGIVDPSKFIKKNANLVTADFYTVPEAEKINNIYKDLGLPDRVKSGYNKSEAGYTFDKKGFTEALKNMAAEVLAANSKAQKSSTIGSSPASVGKLAIKTGNHPVEIDDGPTKEQIELSKQFVVDPRKKNQQVYAGMPIDLTGGYY